ncbi:MAG: hypothetical protein D6761_08675 [Candidatus Dadabacteria bacterium]|nr:MAG: hypothetical protein D6761_08675 [Candidatus Dadabacteria bacterium]
MPASKALSLMLAVVIGGLACRGDQNASIRQGKKAAEQNAIAKQYLADGRYTDAKLQFQTVLREVDGTNAEARFGMVLSDLLQFVSIIRVVNQLAGDAAAADENEFLHDLIDDLLTDLIDRFDNLAFELKRLKADPVFRFVLDQPTPVYLTDTEHPTLDLQGEWDRGEVFLLDALVQVALGALNYAQAIELHADYLAMFNRFTELDINLSLDGDNFDQLLESIEKEVPKIQNLIAGVLNDNPAFLTFDSGTGVQQAADAGDHFATAVDDLRKALFFASYDVKFDEDQSDDVIAFLGRGDNKLEPIDDEADLCAIRDEIVANPDDTDLEDQNTFRFQLRLLFVDDNEDGVEDDDALDSEELSTSPEAGCFITKLMDSLLPDGDPRSEGTDGRLNLVNDIVPFALNLVDDTIANVLAGDTVENFIGNAVELDLGPIFYSGLSPRDLLIAWDTPAMEPDADLRLIWMELECVFDTATDPVAKLRASNYPAFATKMAEQPYRVYDRLFCRDGSKDTPVDIAKCGAGNKDECDIRHFPAVNSNPATTSLAGSASVNAPSVSFGISSLNEDGVASLFPYLPLQAPSFGGVLYLDVYSIAQVVDFDDDKIPAELTSIDGSVGFTEADQQSFNAWLALLSRQLGPLLDLIP